MKEISTQDGLITIEFSKSEMEILRGALIEVCFGVEIGDGEFSTRVGSERRDAVSLLDSITVVMRRQRNFPTAL